MERASGERQSALDAAAYAATVKGILREMNDPAHGGSPDKAIQHFWSGAGEQVLDGGAEIDKKPDRRIAEWGAEFENLQSSVPGDAAQTPSAGGHA